MGYYPEKGEVFFCGSCRRQQQTSSGIKCTSCGRTTVSWYTLRESAADAQRKWNNIVGR